MSASMDIQLISRLMNNNSTRNIVLSSLQSTSPTKINFYDVLLNNDIVKVDDVQGEIWECLEFWNVGGKRKLFKDLVEDRIIRLTSSA